MKSRVFLASLGVAGAAILVGQLSAKSSESTFVNEQNINPLGGSNLGPGEYDIWPCRIKDLRSFGSIGTFPTGSVALAFETKGANAGTDFLPWRASRNVDHPVIGMNLFRITAEGRIEQVGMSWLKHAWAAVQGSGCGTCQSGGNSRLLAPGCADTYGESLNADQAWLAPRWEITPHLHKWMDGQSWVGSHFEVNGDGSGRDTSRHNAVEHRLRVQMGDLTTPGADYWIEGFYHILRDSNVPRWDNLFEFPDFQFNNTTHARVVVNHGGGDNFTFTNSGGTTDGPLISKWANDNGGSFERAAPVDDGVAYVASRAVDLGNGQWRYEYAVYNLNVSAELNSVCIPAGNANVTNINQYYPRDGYWVDATTFVNESPYSDAPWDFVKDGSNAIFSAADGGGMLRNNIRYGTTYTFWYTSDAAPGAALVSMQLGLADNSGVISAGVIGPSIGEAAILTNVNVSTGTVLDGGLPDLLASDDSYVHTRSGFGRTLIDLHNMSMLVDATTTVHAASVDITVEDRIDQAAGAASVSLLNINTGRYDRVGSYAINTTESVHSFLGIAAAEYVDGTGNLQVRVMHNVFVPFFAFTFESWVDEVRIDVH